MTAAADAWVTLLAPKRKHAKRPKWTPERQHECDKLNDDRPPVAPVAELLARFENHVKHLRERFPDGPARYTEKGGQQ